MPEIRKEPIVVPVFKTGKDKTKADSYRPVSQPAACASLQNASLTPLVWHLEIKAFFNLEQVPFRQDRSTEDQIIYLTQEIEDRTPH